MFQRSGNWFLPRRNRAYPGPVKMLIQRVPGVQALRRQLLFRLAEMVTASIRNPATAGWLLGLRTRLFMRWQLRNPKVRRKAWPDYTASCKRVLFSSAFLPALQRDNVEPITSVTEAGPVTEGGRVHEVDWIIYAAGFKTNDFMFPMDISGVGGRTLRAAWAARTRTLA